MSTKKDDTPVSESRLEDSLGHLTRQQLKELEEKEKTRSQKILDFIVMILPVICGFIAIIEYWEVPNGSPNFLVKGDVIFCGYGFTAEDDYLYQLDKNTGEVIEERQKACATGRRSALLSFSCLPAMTI